MGEGAMSFARQGILALVASWAACATPRPAQPDPIDAGVSAPAEDSTGLAAVALDVGAPVAARAKALRALASRTGVSALSVAAICLTSDARELRLSAADVLGALGGKDAKAALLSRLAVEEDEGVRNALQRGVDKSEP